MTLESKPITLIGHRNSSSPDHALMRLYPRNTYTMDTIDTSVQHDPDENRISKHRPFLNHQAPAPSTGMGVMHNLPAHSSQITEAKYSVFDIPNIRKIPSSVSEAILCPIEIKTRSGLQVHGDGAQGKIRKKKKKKKVCQGAIGNGKFLF